MYRFPPQLRYTHILLYAVIICAQNFFIYFRRDNRPYHSFIDESGDKFIEHDLTALYRGTPRSNALLRKLTAAAILKRSARRPILYACIFIMRRNTIIIFTMSRCIFKRALFFSYDEIISRNVHIIATRTELFEGEMKM